MSAPLTDDEKTYLLALARGVITAIAAGERGPEPETRTAALSENRGAFVTLHSNGRLRGCIGYIEGIKPLAGTVADNALSAAFRDPRFPPVAASEVGDLHIEISALTPLRPVDHWRDIEIPRHGVVLARGPRRAVFLPQVAAEEGWDRDTMLSHLAMKAGLEADAWREGASFQVFEAEVFAEKEPG
jgi:AmmeMemoRadiSam system protein A